MTSVQEKINFFKENLEMFDDDMDKYKYLLEQAKNAKKFPEEFRQETFKVNGCQAQVWLVPFSFSFSINGSSLSCAIYRKRKAIFSL